MTEPEVLQRKHLLDTGIGHAWDWFALHANQRMQGVNFFLLAAAFLTSAYVTAIHYSLAVIGAGISILGLIYSVGLLLFEMRVRELLKASEKALIPAQQALADATEIPTFRICEAVEQPALPGSSYHKIILLMYGSTAACFIAAAIYALYQSALSSHRLPALAGFRTVIALCGIYTVYLGQSLFTRRSVDRSWRHWVLAAVLICAGCAVLILTVVKGMQ